MDFSSSIYLSGMMIRKTTLGFIFYFICDSCFCHFFFDDCKDPSVFIEKDPTTLLTRIVRTEESYSLYVQTFKSKYQDLLFTSPQSSNPKEKIDSLLQLGGEVLPLNLIDALNLHIIFALGSNRDIVILEFTPESSVNALIICNEFENGFFLKRNIAIEDLSHFSKTLFHPYLIAKSDRQWLGKIFLPNEDVFHFINGIKQQICFASQQAFDVPVDTGDTGQFTCLSCFDHGWSVIRVPNAFITDGEKRSVYNECKTSIVKFLAEKSKSKFLGDCFTTVCSELPKEPAPWGRAAGCYTGRHLQAGALEKKAQTVTDYTGMGLPAPRVDRSTKPKSHEKDHTCIRKKREQEQQEQMDLMLAKQLNEELNMPEGYPFVQQQELYHPVSSKSLDVTLTFWETSTNELRELFHRRPMRYKDVLREAKRLSDEYKRFERINSICKESENFFNEVQGRMNKIELSCQCDNDYPEDVIQCFMEMFVDLIEIRLENITLDLKDRNYNERSYGSPNMPDEFDNFNKDLLRLIKGCSEKGRGYLAMFESCLEKDDFTDVLDQAKTLMSWVHENYESKMGKQMHLPNAEQQLNLPAMVAQIRRICDKPADSMAKRAKLYKLSQRLFRCMEQVKNRSLSLAGEVPLVHIEEAFDLIIKFFSGKALTNSTIQAVCKQESHMLGLFIEAMQGFRRPAKLHSQAFDRILATNHWSDEDVKQFIGEFLSTDQAKSSFSAEFKNKLRVAIGLDQDNLPYYQRVKEKPLLTSLKEGLQYMVESYKKDTVNYHKLNSRSESLLLTKQSYYLLYMIELYLGERVLIGYEYRKTIKMLSQIETFKRKIFHRFFITEIDDASDSLSSSKLFHFAMGLATKVVNIKMEYRANGTSWAMFYDARDQRLGEMQFECLSPDGVPYLNSFANSMMLALGRERTMTIAITPGSHQISERGVYYYSVEQVMAAHKLRITDGTAQKNATHHIGEAVNSLSDSTVSSVFQALEYYGDPKKVEPKFLTD